MQLSITSQAETVLTNLLSSGKTTKINGFKVGTTAGFTPTKAGTSVTGTSVYIGGPEMIKFSKISENEITLMLVIDHDVGNFLLGNLMIFLDPIAGATSQTPVPFLWVALNSQTEKDKSDLANYEIGNKMIIHATVYFPYITRALNLTQHEEIYARFTNVSNEKTIQDPDIAEYDQYVLDTHTEFNASTFVIKDSLHSLWWAPILNQYIDDPYLGTVQGGIAGNGYGYPSDMAYYDCKHYKLNNDDFDLIDGGADWIGASETPVSGGTYA